MQSDVPESVKDLVSGYGVEQGIIAPVTLGSLYLSRAPLTQFCLSPLLSLSLLTQILLVYRFLAVDLKFLIFSFVLSRR